MAPVQVTIKHAGKSFPVDLDTALSAVVFKDAIYKLTGVPGDRMKVMIKGGVLKDDTDWRKVGVKAGQTFMVIGTAGELPKPPPAPVVFLEDMNDAQLADALRMPVGLVNLGNTCYMNSTLQCLRAIPELHTALESFHGRGDSNNDLTAAMRDLYSGMSKTTEGFPPFAFLQLLRTVAPQFAEMREGHFAQQDADECWGQIISSLANAQLTAPGSSSAGADTATRSKFVEQYLMGEMTKTLTSDETPDELPKTTTERILKLDCNISMTTNYMHSGISDSLNQKITKRSETLGREAVYTETSRISRLPTNLVVHMVRFYWRRDINKKAKIMRKVKFSFELDALDLVTDDLKAKLSPLNRKLKEIEKERDERRKVRKRTKAKAIEDAAVAAVTSNAATSSTSAAATSTATAVSTKDGDVEMKDETVVTPAVLEDEKVIRQRETKALEELVNPDLKSEVGASLHGLYELVGLVTHKGASADSGHYIGWVKKDSIDPPSANNPSDDWYKFDDDKVSVVDKDKITSLDGGGEDSTAYILLYRSKRID